jgi:hypothetical protein
LQVKLFTKHDCPRCPAATHACEGIESLQVYDLMDIDGLAEAAFYNVMATPTVLVLNADGAEVAAWRGEAPSRAELRAVAVA